MAVMIEIVPAQAQRHVELELRAAQPPTSVVGEPGTHGAGRFGMHGAGVNTPRAAAVAAITAGFAGLRQRPNGFTFSIGTLSKIVAIGWFVTVEAEGITVSAVGVAPMLHISSAPLPTAIATSRTYRAHRAPGAGRAHRGGLGQTTGTMDPAACPFVQFVRSRTVRSDLATSGFGWLAAAVERRAVRVWIEDGHAIFRRGLASCLDDRGVSIVGISGNFEPEPDPAKVDVLVFEAERRTFQRALALTRGHSTRLIAVVPSENDDVLCDAIQSGASSALPRAGLNPRRLVQAVHAVADGATLVPDGVVPRLLERAAAGGTSSTRTLTEREVSVLRLLADGDDTRQIGTALGYSERTVKNMVHDLLMKMNCRNRVHAVAEAVRQGLC